MKQKKKKNGTDTDLTLVHPSPPTVRSGQPLDQ